MSAALDRRRLLRAAAGGVGALCLPRAVLGQRAPALEITRLDDTLAVVAGAGCNVVVARGEEGGAFVVDGGSKERSAELLALIRDELSVPSVATLFNTCWHAERTGLNEALGAAGATIIAHENTRLWLTRDVTTPWDNRTVEQLPVAARPNSTFYDSGAARIAGRQVEYGYLLQAHTDGDMYVHLPNDNVLITGAAISSNAWPLLDWWTGGWLGGLVDAFDVLLDVADDDTRIVPGQGGIMTRLELLEQREMFVTIFDRVAERFFAGLEPADVLAAEPTKEFDARYGDPELFLRLAFRGFGLHFGPDA